MSTTSTVSFDNCEQLNLYDDVYMHLRNRDVHGFTSDDDVYMHLRNRDVHNSHESLHTNVMPDTTVKSHVNAVHVKHAKPCKKVNFSQSDETDYDEIYMHLRNRDVMSHHDFQDSSVPKLRQEEEKYENLSDDEIYMHLRNRDIMTHHDFNDSSLEKTYTSVMDYFDSREKQIISRLTSLKKLIGYE
jgi:hypothetical protein